MATSADPTNAASADAARTRERLAVLVDANAAMKGPAPLDARLQRVVAALVPRFGDVASIALFGADGAPLDVVVSSVDPADAESLARAWAPAWSGLRGSRPGADASADAAAELSGRDVAVVPLTHQGAAVGGLLVATRCGPHTIDDVLLFAAVADRVALAVENWRRAREVEIERARVLQIVSDAPMSLAVLRGPEHTRELVNALASRVRPRAPADDAANGGAAADVEHAYASGEVVASAEVPVCVARDDGAADDEAYFDFVHQPVRGAEGTIDAVISVGVDVTERVAARRRAEQLTAELHRSEETFRAAFSHAAFGMAITDLDGRYLRVNDAFCAITGRAAEQLVGVHFSSITHASDHAAGAVALEQLQRGEINVILLEKRYLRPDGAVVWVNLSASVVRDDRGAPTSFVSMIEDVSERRRLLVRERAARAEAEQANQLKDQFLATVSHELRTPLNAMLGWLMLLRSDRIPPERRSHALETVERNAKVQVQLVEDLLDIARIISGKLEVERRPVDVGAVARAEVDSAEPAADAKGVRLAARIEPTPHVVFGDPRRLAQVVANLLANAIKFTPKGGEVHVDVAARGPLVEIVVRDTGRGIAPEFLPHVFERVRQADGGTTRAHGGLGIGLAITKTLVELHGGSVRAESAGVGGGATFAVRLPVIQDRRRATPEEGPPSSASWLDPPPELRGLRVIVVDDDADARDVVNAWLTGAGAEVRVAASGAEALAELDRAPCDLVLSDVAMPGEDGYALLRRIRDRAVPVPVIALTALARREDRARALRAGFASHVPKPVEPAELFAVVASLARPSRDR